MFDYSKAQITSRSRDGADVLVQGRISREGNEAQYGEGSRCDKTERRPSVRERSLVLPLISSCMIHGAIILLAATATHQSVMPEQNFFRVGLVDLPRPETPPPPERIEAPPEIKKPPPPPLPKAEKPKKTKPAAKVEIAKQEPPLFLPAPPKEEPAKVTESKPAPPVPTEASASLPSISRLEGGGSEAGAGNLFGRGEVGVIPGAGTAGGGGGTASSGLGRGSGAPGLPAQTAPIKTNREAKPIQTARAAYPPMALRAGLESDVTLRIIVDPAGNVTRAEIVKSGGAGFDEEALEAVKQSRFEPAQREGQTVPAEFTFIYRFRLQR